MAKSIKCSGMFNLISHDIGPPRFNGGASRILGKKLSNSPYIYDMLPKK